MANKTELATDLKDVYPEKDVTLIHSRQRLMPIYPIEMHNGSKLDGGNERRSR